MKSVFVERLGEPTCRKLHSGLRRETGYLGAGGIIGQQQGQGKKPGEHVVLIFLSDAEFDNSVVIIITNTKS